MHVKAEYIILIFYSLGFSVLTFRMPNLDVNSNIETDSSQTNTGLIHSSIRKNWSQSLNIGSVSIIPAHFKMDWYNISDERMLALRTACPALSYIGRTVHGLRQFLSVMELQAVKVLAKKTVISAAILAAHPLGNDVVNSYYTVSHPKPPDNVLYDDLLHYMNVTRSSVTYLERKVMNIIDLLELFDKYSRAVDPMDSWLVELDIGEMSLSEAKYKMKQALMLQKDVERA